VGLPDHHQRIQILKILLKNENFSDEFNWEGLATATDSFSGSDLKDLYLCAATYPIHDFLQEEKECENSKKEKPKEIRLLCYADFLKAKVEISNKSKK